MNNAAPRDTHRLVRIPAGRLRTTAFDSDDRAEQRGHRQPQEIFLKRKHALPRISHALNEILHTYSLNCVNFAKCRALACISAALQVRSRSKPEFLHRKAPQHRTIDHRAPQGGIALVSALPPGNP